jgi:GT2 family glycosyltransferase
VSSGGATTVITVGESPAAHAVKLEGPALSVIDNAGSVLRRDLYGADRGHLRRDDGSFDEPVEVFSWYGGSSLLSVAYVEEMGGFYGPLFMYYEDLDLAWRGRLAGWRYRYVPQSVALHVHSASSVEGSSFSQYYGERNRLVVVCRNAPVGKALTSVFRYLLSTASYARRDLASPLLRGERPRPEMVKRRLRSFFGFLRLSPEVVMHRLRARRIRRVDPHDVLRTAVLLASER